MRMVMAIGAAAWVFVLASNLSGRRFVVSAVDAIALAALSGERSGYGERGAPLAPGGALFTPSGGSFAPSGATPSSRGECAAFVRPARGDGARTTDRAVDLLDDRTSENERPSRGAPAGGGARSRALDGLSFSEKRGFQEVDGALCRTKACCGEPGVRCGRARARCSSRGAPMTKRAPPAWHGECRALRKAGWPLPRLAERFGKRNCLIAWVLDENGERTRDRVRASRAALARAGRLEARVRRERALPASRAEATMAAARDFAADRIDRAGLMARLRGAAP